MGGGEGLSRPDRQGCGHARAAAPQLCPALNPYVAASIVRPLQAHIRHVRAHGSCRNTLGKSRFVCLFVVSNRHVARLWRTLRTSRRYSCAETPETRVHHSHGRNKDRVSTRWRSSRALGAALVSFSSHKRAASRGRPRYIPGRSAASASGENHGRKPRLHPRPELRGEDAAAVNHSAGIGPSFNLRYVLRR